MELGPYPSLGWTVSRARDLHPEEGGCERRYYLKGPGSWQGWEVDERHAAWLPYRLKNLATVRAKLGILVHDVARELVLQLARGEKLPDYDTLVERCWADLQVLRHGNRERFLQRPKKYPFLLQSWYGLEDEISLEFAEAKRHLEDCVANLLESDVLDEVATAGTERLLLCDAVDSVEFAFSEEDSVTVWAAPDVAYWSDDGTTLTIVDWKTGSTRGADLQLAAYALYLRARFRIAFREGRFRGRVVALGPEDVDRTRFLTAEDLIQAHARIRSDVVTMRSLLADEATGESLPRWEFPMVGEDQRGQCSRCSFAQICSTERQGGTSVRSNHAGSTAAPVGGAESSRLLR